MCGIYASISKCYCKIKCSVQLQEMQAEQELLKHRGPDASSCVTIHIGNLSVVLKATVLWLQGSKPAPQPLSDDDGNILLFNGDVLAGDLMPPPNESDSTHLLNQLYCSDEQDLPELISKILGPWSFIYYRKSSQRLYFGRDVLGRHSLLWSHKEHSSPNLYGNEKCPVEASHNEKVEIISLVDKSNENLGQQKCSPIFVLSSVCGCGDLEEVPTYGIFVLDLKNMDEVNSSYKFPVSLIPWDSSSSYSHFTDVHIAKDSFMISPIKEQFNMVLPDPDSLLGGNTQCDAQLPDGSEPYEVFSDGLYVKYSDVLLNLLLQSVQRRVAACPSYCLNCSVSNSRGIDECNQGGFFVPDALKLEDINDHGSLEGKFNVNPVGIADTENGISFNPKIRGNGTATLSCKLNDHRLANSIESCSINHEVTSEKALKCFSSKRADEAMNKSDRSMDYCGHCRVAVLFSGGLDSAVIALLLGKCLPVGESIDLINVAFPTHGEIAPQKSKKRTKNIQHQKLRKVSCPVDENIPKEPTVSDTQSRNNMKTLNLLSVEHQRKLSLCSEDNGVNKSTSEELKDNCNIEPMSQETEGNSPDIRKSSQDLGNNSNLSFEVPDRVTGRLCLQQLQTLCPDRSWNFVEVNVSREELEACRASHIRPLLRPHNTVLDDSIGCALWFAGRGQGLVSGQPYVSPARVLLCGHGADEQLCGYSRHRSAFRSGGHAALLAETRMDVERLPSRNLGRDNRILADSARAPRLPYLDEDVVTYLNSLPIWLKADLRLPRGVGEKLLLRVLAYRQGLTYAAGLPKRAIQFGSRIAKMDDRKEKGDQVCCRLAA